jgi:hypothetical protein
MDRICPIYFYNKPILPDCETNIARLALFAQQTGGGGGGGAAAPPPTRYAHEFRWSTVLAKLFRFTTQSFELWPSRIQEPAIIAPLLLRCFTSCSPGKMNRNWKRTLNCQNNVCHENYNQRSATNLAIFLATRSSHFINMYWTKRISLIFVTWALFKEYNY